MTRTQKSLLIIFFTIIIILAMILIFNKTITSLTIQDVITKEFSELTSEKIHIEGPIEWQLLPRPRLKINQIKIGETPTGKRAKTHAYFSANHIILNLKLIPLLKRQIVFNEITLEGVTLYLNQKETSKKTDKLFPLSKLTHQNNSTKNPSSWFLINTISLTNSQIIIIQPGRNITLNNIQFFAKHINLQKEFFPVTLQTDFTATLANNKIKAFIHYEGNTCLDQSFNSQPLLALQKFSTNGELLIKNTQINQFKITKITSTLSINNKTLTFRPLNLFLYHGKSIGDVHYHFSTQELTMNQTASNLDANPFLKDFFKTNIVKGKLDFSIHNTINFNQPNWQDNLLEQGTLTIKNGRLHFINLQKMIENASITIHSLQDRAKNRLKKTQNNSPLNPTLYEEGSSRFQLLNLQYALLNHRVINNNLVLQANGLLLKGNGQVSLTDEAINGQLSATFITNDSTINQIQQLLGGSFPLTLNGTVTQPIIAPNIQMIRPLLTKYLISHSLKEPIKQLHNQFKNIIMVPKLLFQS